MWLAAALAGSSVVGGCATVGRLQFVEPRVALREVRIAALGISGGTLTLVLDVHNPNRFDIRGLGMEAHLDLDDTRFGDALVERPWDLPHEATTPIEVPLRFNWDGVGAGARAILTHGAVPYRLGGTIRVRTPLGPRPIRLGSSGTVTVLDLLP